MEKRKRPDRAARFQDCKTRRETVVKSALKKYVKGDAPSKERFVQEVKSRVDAFSKRVCIASINLSGLLKDAFAGQDDVCNVALPDIFKLTFFRQLMLGVNSALQPDPSIARYMSTTIAVQLPTERHLGDSNIYSYGATKYITNLRNSLKGNFARRVRSQLSAVAKVHKVPTAERVAALYALLGWKRPPTVQPLLPEHTVMTAFVAEQRRILGLGTGAKVTDAWLDREGNQLNVLRQWVAFNRFRADHRLVLFTLVPMCRVRRHFITIDSTSLFGVMKDAGMVSGAQDAFVRLHTAHWGSILDVGRLAKSGTSVQAKAFSYIVDSDGTSLSTHFRARIKEGSAPLSKRKQPKQTSGPPVDSSVDRVVAIDPGRVIIYQAVEAMADGRFKTYSLTRRQYYNDSGVFEARRQSEVWNAGVQAALAALSTASPKGVDVQRHAVFVEVYSEHQAALWAEYTKERWARQRLRLYGGKKRTYDRFFNAIKDGDEAPERKRRVVIAYGAAGFDPTAKNELSAPTTRAYKECKRRYSVKDVDEFRTSKVHCRTGEVLQGVVVRRFCTNGKRMPRVPWRQLKVLRGLLWCDSTIDENMSKFVSRDFNAAVNIWRCATGERPVALQRLGLPKLVLRVGKAIKNCSEPVNGR